MNNFSQLIQNISYAVQQFQEFRKTGFTGTAEEAHAKVQQMMDSGQIRQQDFNTVAPIARYLQTFFEQKGGT